MNTRFSKTARSTLLWLVVGVTSIIVASLFNFGIYVGTLSKQPNRWAVARDMMKVVVMSQNYNLEARELFLLDGKGYTVKMVNQPAKNSEVLTRFNRKFLMKKFLTQYSRGYYSVPLLNGRWLVLREQSFHDSWMYGFVLVAVLFFIMLVAICFWAVRRLSMPIRQFMFAVERFSRDVQAPNMLVEGGEEEKELQQKFNEMQSRVRRLIMDRTQMLTAISHDLRTPITRLKLRAEYLQGSEQYEKVVKDLDEIDSMIHSILSFARDYSASEVVEEFDLDALLESIAVDMQDAGKWVEFRGTGCSQPYLGKVNALRRAFNNLIDNGVKYGNKVNVVLRESSSGWNIQVEDQGPGVAESEKDKVFAPFFRGDSSRSSQKSGTGLGLAVSRDIIRAHGGEIDLENKTSGTGLVVTVTLPRVNLCH